jgi:hypothetical protein
MDAGSVRPDRERHLTEVPLRQRFDQVVLPVATPHGDIVLRDQDGARPLMAAGSAAKAREVSQARTMARAGWNRTDFCRGARRRDAS